MAKNKTIKFTGKQLEKFLSNDGTHPDFSNWKFESDTSEGEYDGEHGAMVDFPLYMYNKETKERYEGYGGYYNEGAGECYDEPSIEFTQFREVVEFKGKKGKKYFEATISIKVYVEDNENSELTWVEAEKIIKDLEQDKFKVSNITL